MFQLSIGMFVGWIILHFVIALVQVGLGGLDPDYAALCADEGVFCGTPIKQVFDSLAGYRPTISLGGVAGAVKQTGELLVSLVLLFVVDYEILHGPGIVQYIRVFISSLGGLMVLGTVAAFVTGILGRR